MPHRCKLPTLDRGFTTETKNLFIFPPLNISWVIRTIYIQFSRDTKNCSFVPYKKVWRSVWLGRSCRKNSCGLRVVKNCCGLWKSWKPFGWISCQSMKLVLPPFLNIWHYRFFFFIWLFVFSTNIYTNSQIFKLDSGDSW